MNPATTTQQEDTMPRSHYIDSADRRVTAQEPGRVTLEHRTLCPGTFRPGDHVTGLFRDGRDGRWTDDWTAAVTGVDLAGGVVTMVSTY